MNQSKELLLFNIRFWIVLFFLIRLIGIQNPPLEMGHSWRQITNYMVCRNFLETDNNIMYPRVDDNHGGSGLVGMEFPLLNYSAYTLSKFFGYNHIWGRLINLIVSSFGLFFFYKVIKIAFHERIAFFSTMLLLFSAWFPYSRKFMADTFCISLAFISIYTCILYFKKEKIIYLLLFFVFSTLAVLSKIPAGIYFALLPLAYIYLKDNYPKKILFTICAFVSIVVTYIWYFIWCPSIAQSSGTWYNCGNTLTKGFREVKSDLYGLFEKFYFCSFSSFIFFFVFIAGGFIIIKKKEINYLIIIALITFSFAFYIIKSGHFFTLQSYYIIPFVPVMALVGGKFLAEIRQKKIWLSLLILGSVESVANQYHDFFNPIDEIYKLNFEEFVNKIVPAKSLVMVNGGDNPQMLYFVHHKGWTCDNDKINDTFFTNDLIKKGCEYFICDKHLDSYNPPEGKYKVVFENKDVIILKP